MESPYYSLSILLDLVAFLMETGAITIAAICLEGAAQLRRGTELNPYDMRLYSNLLCVRYHKAVFALKMILLARQICRE